MRIDLAGELWDAAVIALVAGNQDAAGTHARLADALAETGAMAGTDANADAFAPHYDRVAQVALDDLGQVVAAYAALARLTRASLDHHRTADAASTLDQTTSPRQIWCDDPTTPVYDADTVYAPRQVVAVSRRTVPASRGADLGNTGLSGLERWVLDHVRGFIWPDADVDQLRRAATAWATAADEVDELYRHCHTARTGLERQSAPEIPVAVTAIGNLDAATTTLGGQLRALGLACTTYADNVETHRRKILDIVRGMLRDAAIVEGIGLVLGAVTEGLTAEGATALNAQRIRARAPAILRIVETLVDLTRGATQSLRIALTDLGPPGAALRCIASARVVDTAAHAVTLGTGMAGLGTPPLSAPAGSRAPARIDLCDDEGVDGAHTIGRHVGQTDQQLRRRLKDEPKTPAASSFDDLLTANRLIDLALRAQDRTIEEWLTREPPNKRLRLSVPMDEATGRCLFRNRLIVGRGLRVVLQRRPGSTPGYVILTSYPIL